MTVTLWIEGAPQGKGRPRFSARGAVYTPAATKLAEGRIIDAWTNEGQPRLDGPIAVDLTLWVARPKGHYRKNGELSAAGAEKPLPVGKKPDLDNAVKLAMDALNGRAYRDDVDVIELCARRAWSMDGWERTRIIVRELGRTNG
jgi:Holliday junction resolvase RusA-like endonuclease